MPRPQPGAERNLRLFVAVELPPGVLAALQALIDDLRHAGIDEGLRYVRPVGIHLTLKFLGATPPARVPQIVDALTAATTAIAPFEVQPSGIGAFHGGRQLNPDWLRREAYRHNIRVVWVGLGDGGEALRGLAECIENVLNPLGYPREQKDFFPHLTLARVRDDASRSLREAIAGRLEPYLSRSTRTTNYRPELVRAIPSFPVDALHLMQSTPQRGGAVYQSLATIPFARDRASTL
jgi:2'-5' RNA ligase